MELMEKTVESRVLFEGKIITVRLDKAELPRRGGYSAPV